jgi:hypothetical protein
MRSITLFLLLFLVSCSGEELESLGVPSHFSAEYQQANRGKVQYQTPEVYELIQVAIALTPTGRRDCLTERNTAYYRAVMTHFDKFQKHPLVTQLETWLADNRWSYTSFEDAATYEFEGERIVAGGIYSKHPLHPDRKFADYRALAEDFARVTGFRAFYQGQQPLYQAALNQYRQSIPITGMWEWLEKQFPDRYDSYQLNLSPLMGCFHFTNNREGDGFRQTRMFVPLTAVRTTAPTLIEQVGLNRMVFTEIDHNYVNAMTSQYAKDLNKAMKNWRDWNDGRGGYESRSLTFNEYMTWAVFTLYVYDTTTPEVFAQIRADKTEWVDTFMPNRGFRRFPAFNAQLLSLYQTRKPGQTVADLYPAMLNWVANQ